MKRRRKLFPIGWLLAGLIVSLGAGTASGADVSISIYGNLGPAGLEQPWYDSGGAYIQPPYGGNEREGGRGDDRDRRAAPARPENRRSIPSIPSNRRPQPSRGDSRGRSQDKRH